MKMSRQFCGSLLAALMFCAAPGYAADVQQTDATITVDSKGDGEMMIALHLSAMQWASWKARYGDRPDVLWRDLKYRFAKIALDKFDLQRNDVDRMATVRIQARALAVPRDDDTFEMDMPKEYKPVSHAGVEWIFASSTQAASDSSVVTEIFHVDLPADSKNARLEGAGTFNQKMVYEMPDSAAPGKRLLELSLIGLIGAAIALMLSRKFRKI